VTEYRNPDLDLPSVTLEQLKAIDAIVRRHLPSDCQLLELEVRPREAESGNPAPLEVRATVLDPSGPAIGEQWTTDLAAEIRAGWDRADFKFSMHFKPDGGG